MPKAELSSCKRPYTLGKRLEQSDLKRTAILLAARRQLEQDGLRLTMDSLAAESGVTRQTVHNLFGTKTGVLEALFDQIALDGGMEQMRNVMQQTNPEQMLASFVQVFTNFWVSAPMLLRRVHGIAAIDPEFGRVIDARNRRRQMAATRVVDVFSRGGHSVDSPANAQKVATLVALTSFEFFDALTAGSTRPSSAAEVILSLAKTTLSNNLLP